MSVQDSIFKMGIFARETFKSFKVINSSTDIFLGESFIFDQTLLSSQKVAENSFTVDFVFSLCLYFQQSCEGCTEILTLERLIGFDTLHLQLAALAHLFGFWNTQKSFLV